MTDDAASDGKEPTWLRPLTIAAFTMAVLGALAAATLAIVGYIVSYENALWNSIGTFGVAASLCGLGVALLIFSRQQKDSHSMHLATTEQLGRVEDALGRNVERLELSSSQTPLNEEEQELSKELSGEDDEGAVEPGEEDQTHTAAMPKAAPGSWLLPPEPLTDASGKNRIYLPREIPLSVIADLLQGWRRTRAEDPTRALDPRLPDRWTVNSLIGATRQTGQGNHPWLVVFRSPDGDFRMWRMYRGGRSRKEATVREIGLPPEVRRPERDG